MLESIFVGIDVSKKTLDYTWLPDGKPMLTENTPAGIARLIDTLVGLTPKLIILEATGGYQTPVTLALYQSNIPYKVVNPRQVRDFARSMNRLGKTDKLDALTLAQFGQSRELVPDTPKPQELVDISYFLHRREQLQRMITAEKNHLEHTPVVCQGEVKAIIKTLNNSLKAIDKQISQKIKATPELAKQDRIIQSIPGVGPVTSATILSCLPEISRLGRKELCSLAGLAPFNRDSGKYRGQRHIYGGRANVRKVLYSALRPCLQFNPVIKMWFDRFILAGKAYKVAAIACIRKLLVVIRAMLQTNSSWDSNKYALSA